jgi:hypothetical protein
MLTDSIMLVITDRPEHDGATNRFMHVGYTDKVKHAGYTDRHTSMLTTLKGLH